MGKTTANICTKHNVFNKEEPLSIAIEIRPHIFSVGNIVLGIHWYLSCIKLRVSTLHAGKHHVSMENGTKKSKYEKSSQFFILYP